MTFNIGDKIRCVRLSDTDAIGSDGKCNGYTVGTEYIVSSLPKDEKDLAGFIDSNGESNRFFKFRIQQDFVKIPKKIIVIRRKNELTNE